MNGTSAGGEHERRKGGEEERSEMCIALGTVAGGRAACLGTRGRIGTRAERQEEMLGGRAPLMMCLHRHKKGGRGVYIA